MTTWRCPVCHLDLGEDPAAEPSARVGRPARAWRCDNGHGFDIAREGYVNLLITHQRRRREPGDSAAMVRARRAFLDGGWYEPVREALAAHAPDEGESACDAGCGEGYYTRLWRDVWCIDISKTAVRLAAGRAADAGGGARYAVASAFDLPLADESIDVLVSVFAPLDSAEFERVVRPGGKVVTLTPGPDHLAGLAALLFETVEPHPGDGPFDRPGGPIGLTRESSERIRYDLDLDRPGAVGALLGMTPWAWYVSPETRASVAARAALATPVDVVLTTYRRRARRLATT